jgi:hypothetical protein
LLRVREAGDHRLGREHSLLEEPLLAGRLKQHRERFEQKRIVLQIGVELGVSVVVRAQQPAPPTRRGLLTCRGAVALAHGREQELRAGDRGLGVSLTIHPS